MHLGERDIKVKQIDVNLTDEAKATTINDLVLKTALKADGSNADLSIKVNAKNFSLFNTTYNNLNLSLNASHLDQVSLGEIIDSITNQHNLFLLTFSILNPYNKLIENGFSVNLDDLSVKTPYGPISVNGNLVANTNHSDSYTGTATIQVPEKWLTEVINGFYMNKQIDGNLSNRYHTDYPSEAGCGTMGKRR